MRSVEVSASTRERASASSRASSARSRSARRAAIRPSASRSRRIDCEPTTRDEDRQQPADQQRGEREPLARRGCSTATRPHAVAEPHALAQRVAEAAPARRPARPRRACPPAGAPRRRRARPGGERGQERARRAGARRARTGTATAMLGGEPSTAGRISVARVSPERIAPCSAARPADCSTASRVGLPLPRELEKTIVKRSGRPAGVVGAGAHGGAAAGAAGERDGGQRALVEQARRRARRTARAARTAGPARSRRRR